MQEIGRNAEKLLYNEWLCTVLQHMQRWRTDWSLGLCERDGEVTAK